MVEEAVPVLTRYPGLPPVLGFRGAYVIPALRLAAGGHSAREPCLLNAKTSPRRLHLILNGSPGWTVIFALPMGKLRHRFVSKLCPSHTAAKCGHLNRTWICMTREPRPSTAPKPVFPPSELCNRRTPEAADAEKGRRGRLRVWASGRWPGKALEDMSKLMTSWVGQAKKGRESMPSMYTEDPPKGRHMC